MSEENDELETVKAALERQRKDTQKWETRYKELEGQKGGAYKERALKAEARMRLMSEGIKNPEKLLKHISVDGLDFDDDDNLTGMDEKINELKEDFPTLFDAKARAADVEQFADKNGSKKKLSSSEQQAKLLLGG